MMNPRNKELDSTSIEQVLDIARKVVSRYVGRKVVPSREKEDVVMAVVEKFINQEEKIKKSFEGKSKVTTYLIAVLNRMCCEIIRRDSKHWHSVPDDMEAPLDDGQASHLSEAEKSTLFKNEAKRLAKAMLFFNGDRIKTRLFLRYYFNLPLNKEDIEFYCKGQSDVLKELLIPSETLSKAEKFDQLATIVNLVEGKDVKGDAVRMWLNKQIDILLNRMNGNGASEHSKESLEVLFEMQDYE